MISKGILKNTKISLVVLFFYFISNFLILNLINKSDFNEKKYICEKMAYFKLKFYNQEINNNVINLVEFLATDKNIEKLDKLKLKIIADKIETCNEKISFIHNEIDKLVSDFSIYLDTQKKVAIENNLTDFFINIEGLTIEELLNLYDIKLIELVIYHDKEYFIDNTFYTTVIIIIFNLFLIIFFLTIYVFVRNKKFFGSILKKIL